MKLTAKTVASLSLGDKADVIHFDEDLSGFGYRLRAGAGGKVKRSWIAQYRRAGATRRVLLGSDVLSPEQARAAAKKVLAQATLGNDPQADKHDRRDRDRLSLRSVLDEYLLHKKERLRAKTFGEVSRYLTGSYFRQLHGMPVDAVTRKDVASVLVTITRQRSPITAGLARGALQAFFVWAMQQGLVESNPVVGTAPPDMGKARERVLSDQELVAIWNACGDDDYGRIVRLLWLTGCRRQEVGGMAWGELDLERGLWTIPAARSKNGRAHTLPLMPMVLDIIAQVPRMVSRDQLFGTRAASGFCDWGKAKAALDARCGVSDWTVHDIRRTVATRLADLGIAPHVIEQILNHQSGHRAGVAGVYNRSSYEREVRAALALWEDHIRSLVGGGARKVVALAAG